MANERRSQFLVNRELQLYFIFYALIFGIVFTVAGILADYHFEQTLMLTIANLSKGEEMEYLRDSISQMRTLKTRIATGVALIFLIVWAVQAYYMSHRIAGPVFKATQYLREVAETGNRRTLAFRQHDFFLDLAEAINQALPPQPGTNKPGQDDKSSQKV